MRAPIVVASLAAALLTVGCARPVRVAPITSNSSACRSVPAGTALRWTAPDDAGQRARLDRWCDGVGAPIVNLAPPSKSAVDRLTIVAWNVHVGQGDVLRLLSDLRDGPAGGTSRHGVVLLLQEAWRSGRAVPTRMPPGTRVAARIAPPPGGRPSIDVRELAARLGWSLVYVPSMRNGRGAPEDRGTAVLSSVPLGAPHAIELPVERQRRVALATRIAAVTSDGRPWSLEVVSVHLENRPGIGRGWIRAAAARTRQVEALLLALTRTADAAVDELPMVLGGDLNTWRGGREQALRLLAREFPRRGDDDVRPTFGRFRLDYLFGRLPDGIAIRQRRLDDAYGSDHFPVVAEMDFGVR